MLLPYVKSANALLDRVCHVRVGDFGITRSLNDHHSDITATHMQTENVMDTQVYMVPEYKNGECGRKWTRLLSGWLSSRQ